MQLPANIKPQPWFFKYIPLFNLQNGSAYPNGTIYLRKDIYDDLLTNKPNHFSIGVLIHEQTHIQRMKNTGVIKWGLKYIFSKSFRFGEELAANREQFKHLKKHKVTIDIVKKARYLSGMLYFWPVSYEYAIKELKKVWEEI